MSSFKPLTPKQREIWTQIDAKLYKKDWRKRLKKKREDKRKRKSSY